jgi:hypothetical protein
VKPVSNPERPIPDSYWVKAGQLVAGEYPGDLDEDKARLKVRSLIRAGVTLFVDLTGETELNPYQHILRTEAANLGRTVKHERRAIRDEGVPDEAGMVAILDTLDRAIEAREVVYVHCYGGIGRTGTVVGCYLARHGTPGTVALERIAEWRRGTPDGGCQSPENDRQCLMVREWATGR